MGLNESFSTIQGQILDMDPIPPISKAFSLVLQEEKQHKVAAGAALSTQVAFTIKLLNSVKSGDVKSTKVKKDLPLCTHCGVLGHTQDKCFKLHGFPLDYDKFKGKPAPAIHHVVVLEANSSGGGSSLMHNWL